MSVPTPLFAGIDLGTSGVRAVCVDADLQTHTSASVMFDPESSDRRDPGLWWTSVCDVIRQMLTKVDSTQIAGIAVDGTSGTMLPVNEAGIPMGKALLYNDVCTDSHILQRIKEHAPASSAAHGATSGLARAMTLLKQYPDAHILHEADWIACQLSGLAGISDENNALKTGYDPIHRHWPDWLTSAGMSAERLPEVLPTGSQVGSVSESACNLTGLSQKTQILTGTTDGCASFLATGASNPGDGVTVLGSTLTIKLLSDKPVNAPQYGIYSHRIGQRWLAGGASNTGGVVLAKYFSQSQINELSETIDGSKLSELDYYPLAAAGERFPVNDPQLPARLTPRPTEDSEFLQGILQGIANIEALAYQRLEELGAPPLQTLRTVGGGSANSTWSAIRAQLVSDMQLPSISEQAAVGVASLARDGLSQVS